MTSIRTMSEVHRCLQLLHQSGPRVVAITSAELSDYPDKLCCIISGDPPSLLPSYPPTSSPSLLSHSHTHTFSSPSLPPSLHPLSPTLLLLYGPSLCCFVLIIHLPFFICEVAMCEEEDDCDNSGSSSSSSSSSATTKKPFLRVCNVIVSKLSASKVGTSNEKEGSAGVDATTTTDTANATDTGFAFTGTGDCAAALLLAWNDILGDNQVR